MNNTNLSQEKELFIYICKIHPERLIAWYPWQIEIFLRLYIDNLPVLKLCRDEEYNRESINKLRQVFYQRSYSIYKQERLIIFMTKVYLHILLNINLKHPNFIRIKDIIPEVGDFIQSLSSILISECPLTKATKTFFDRYGIKNVSHIFNHTIVDFLATSYITSKHIKIIIEEIASRFKLGIEDTCLILWQDSEVYEKLTSKISIEIKKQQRYEEIYNPIDKK